MKLVKNIETLIFSSRINENFIDIILKKFKAGTIATEKLKGNLQGVLSFRLNKQQRVIAKICPYQAKSALVVLDLLLDHKYERYSIDGALETLVLEGKFATEAWRVYERETIPHAVEPVDIKGNGSATKPDKWSIEVDSVSVLDAQQLAVLEQQHERPIVIITGVAGSGKTLVAELLMEQAQLRNPGDKILYVTQSENLISSVKAHCQQAGFQADIKTFQALCAPMILEKLFKEDNGKHYRELNNKKDFSDALLMQALALMNGAPAVTEDDRELLNYINAHLRSEVNFIRDHKKNESARQLYQDIGKRHQNENFKNLGRKSLHHEPDVIEQEYHAYKKYLTTKHSIDLSVADFSQETVLSYDTILVDESQDFSGHQLRYLHSLLNKEGHFYAFIDTNQSIEDDFTRVYEDIKSLAVAQKKEIKQYELKRGYRNEKKIIELANRLLHCGRILVGGVLSDGLREIEAIEEAHPGYLEWIDVKKGEVSERCERLNALHPSRLAMVVVIPSNSQEDEKLAKQLFPDRMLFTPKEIKGLEFDTIVLINFFNNRAFNLSKQEQARLPTINWKEDDKLNNPKRTDNVIYNRATVEAFVATTRAKQAVYMIQSSSDPTSKLFKESVLADIVSQQESEERPVGNASFEALCRFLEANAGKLSSSNLLILCQEAVAKAGEVAGEAIDKARIHSLQKIKALLYTRDFQAPTDKQLVVQVTTLVEKIEDNISNNVPFSPPSSSLSPPQVRPTRTHSQAHVGLVSFDDDKVARGGFDRSLLSRRRRRKKAADDAATRADSRPNATNFQEIDIEEVTSHQLEEVINGKTGLSILLELRLAALEGLSDPALDKLIRKITSDALSACNDEGFSAIHLIFSLEKHRKIAGRMIRNEKFLSKITSDDLNKLGPNGVPLIFHLNGYGEKFFKKIKNTKKIAPELLNCMETHFPFLISKKLLPKILFDNFGLLHLAVTMGDLPLARYAIKKGINLNAINREGQTALHLLVQNVENYSSPDEAASFFKDLVGQGAAVNINDNLGGVFPIHCASSWGVLEIVQFLVEELGVEVDIATTDHRKTPLHMAAEDGRLVIVEYLVEKEANIQSRDVFLETPLHIASQQGHLATVEYLVEKMAEIDAQDFYLYTPLHRASENGHLPIVKYLVEKGADIHAITANCLTPLHAAAIKNHLPIMDYLVEKGADISASADDGMTALHFSSQAGHCAIVEYLVEKGADISASADDGMTALHFSSQAGHCAIVEYLVEKGADISASADDGMTALHSSSQEGHCDTVEYLVEKGADISASADDGMTALHFSSQAGHCAIVEYLVEKKANMHACDDNGDTPLHVAIIHNRLEIVNFFIGSNQELLEQPNKAGRTPFHLAVDGKNILLVGRLVQAGAVVAAADKDGFTPLHTATQQENWALVQYLVKKGADVNAANTQGMTPLRYAADAGYTDIVKYLLDNQADVNAVAAGDGTTPLYAAAQNGHLSVVKLLVLHGADVSKRSVDGHTAFAIAKAYGHCEVVAYLAAHKGAESTPASTTAKLVEQTSATLTSEAIEVLTTGGMTLGTAGRNSGDLLTHGLQQTHRQKSG